jgi:hypothetical protein
MKRQSSCLLPAMTGMRAQQSVADLRRASATFRTFLSPMVRFVTKS